MNKFNFYQIFFDCLEIPYTVIVQTGSKISSGTDANVFISLFGEKSKIVRRALKKPNGGWNPFEKDQKDEFLFEDDDIGKVRLLYSIEFRFQKLFDLY
jgi:hypothetical protein